MKLYSVSVIKPGSTHHKVLKKLMEGPKTTVELAAYVGIKTQTMSSLLSNYVKINKTVVVCGKGKRSAYLYGLSPLQGKVSQIKPCMDAIV